MAVFVVIPTAREDQLQQMVTSKFEGKHYKLPRGEYLISYTGTSKQLSDELQITNGQQGHGLVVSVNGYFGHAPTDIWEWIKQNWTA